MNNSPSFDAKTGDSLSAEERFRRVEAKIGEWLHKSNKAQLYAAKQWLNAVKTSLSQNENAKLLEEKHWLEAIDALHRYGTNLGFYFNEWKESNSTQPFFEWLDAGDGEKVDLEKCPRRYLQEQRVRYLGVADRGNFEVTAKNGKLVHKKNGNPVDTAEKKWIYALSPSRELFVGKKEKGYFHHSSFLAGAGVLAAGFIQVSQGTIKDLTWSSGHYKPTIENFQQLTRFLEEKQVDLRNVPKEKLEFCLK